MSIKKNREHSLKSNTSSYMSRIRRLNHMSMKLLKSRNSQNKESSSENKSLLRNISSGSRSIMSLKEIHPIKIMTQAYSKVNAIGSATALVAIKHGRKLKIANLGDSGFILIRFNEKNGEPYCVLRSKE